MCDGVMSVLMCECVGCGGRGAGVLATSCDHESATVCRPSSTNQRIYYRQIAGYQRGVGNHRVG